MKQVQLVQTKEQNEAEMLVQQLKQQREELQARLKEAKQKSKGITFEVIKFVDKRSKNQEEQTGIHIHGISAKPMFLYGSQAEALVQVAEELQKFVEENRDQLSWKK